MAGKLPVSTAGSAKGSASSRSNIGTIWQKNFVPIRELGHFPTASELIKLKRLDIDSSIRNHHRGLPFVEAKMREEGLLDFLEKKEE
jgi:hypothetical protein